MWWHGCGMQQGSIWSVPNTLMLLDRGLRWYHFLVVTPVRSIFCWGLISGDVTIWCPYGCRRLTKVDTCAQCSMQLAFVRGFAVKQLESSYGGLLNRKRHQSRCSPVLTFSGGYWFGDGTGICRVWTDCGCRGPQVSEHEEDTRARSL